MATGTPIGDVEFFEDFVRDNVTDLVETTNSSATQDITARHGGWWRQVLAGDDGDALLIAGERAFEPDEGAPVIFEWRGYSTDASVTSAFVGMTDNEAETGAVVIEDEDGTLNTVATDAVGFLLEGEQDATWQAVGVQNDVDNSQVTLTSGADAADSVVQTLRMALHVRDSGTALFYIDGELVSTQTSFVRTSIVYCPAVSSDDRGTAFNFDTDYIYACAPRS